eukprot:GHVU01107284.1.p3 GENE.GHVU01107284.1~~GHVU01107284.1.p3  ORF type:complete len:121 (-),score=7.90 GHVU01107284.1:514-876(-)
MCVCVYTYVHVCAGVFGSVSMAVHVRVCAYICACSCGCVWVGVCVCVHVWMCAPACISAWGVCVRVWLTVEQDHQQQLQVLQLDHQQAGEAATDAEANLDAAYKAMAVGRSVRMEGGRKQ